MFKRFWSRLIGRDQKYDDTCMTPTGETFGEREYYHDHELSLSPGEIAIAHAIRDRLRQIKHEADQEGT